MCILYIFGTPRVHIRDHIGPKTPFISTYSVIRYKKIWPIGKTLLGTYVSGTPRVHNIDYISPKNPFIPTLKFTIRSNVNVYVILPSN